MTPAFPDPFSSSPGTRTPRHGLKSYDFRPFFIGKLGWRRLPIHRSRTEFGAHWRWHDAKNAKLRAERGIGFEDVVFHIERGDLLDILEHPNPTLYADQRILVVRCESYMYLVPVVEDEDTVFLKTIIPSWKATKEYRTLLEQLRQ